MDQRSSESVHHKQTKLNSNEADNIASCVNRALHRKGSSSVRVERIRCTDTGRILGVTTPTSTLQDLLEHQNTVLQAARVMDRSIRDVVLQQKWKWIRIHNISLTRYMGKARDGGLIKLREELEAENSGMHIPAEIRWLGGPPRREREAAAPEAPVGETPAAQEGAEKGGTEVGTQEEGGLAQEGEGMETGEQECWDPALSFLFISWCACSFFISFVRRPWGEGDRVASA